MSDAGDIIVHPLLKVENISELNQESQEVLNLIKDQKEGSISYEWKNPNESENREKLAVLHYMPNYKWIVGSSVYKDEFF